MALLFPWATKEYLLWEMNLGQIIMYYNIGMEIKNGKPKQENRLPSLSEKPHAELQAYKEELKQKYGRID